LQLRGGAPYDARVDTMAGEEKQERLTFLSKLPIVCPVCEKEFHREDLLTGRGRLIAGDLDEDLRRQYEPSKKYGEVFPLVYAVTVCPFCMYAAYPHDFLELGPDGAEAVRTEEEKRRESVALVVEDVDLTRTRGLTDGVAAFILAMMCYEHFDAKLAPSVKKGLCALRGAWCLSDLHARHPGENYDQVARLMFRKARFFYRYALDTMHSGRENLEAVKNFGPDMDNNFGFDGFLYLNGQLEFRHGPRQDREQRLAALESSNRVVAKIFGMGRASKGKPSAILDLARTLHEQIGAEVKSLEGE
jgi:uncharacterized protein (DUF2225 family)